MKIAMAWTSSRRLSKGANNGRMMVAVNDGRGRDTSRLVPPARIRTGAH